MTQRGVGFGGAYLPLPGAYFADAVARGPKAAGRTRIPPLPPNPPADLGTLIAVGQTGIIAKSHDAVFWVDRTPTSNSYFDLNAVAFDGTVWLACGWGDNPLDGLWRSADDGDTWTRSPLPAEAPDTTFNFLCSPYPGIMLMSDRSQIWQSVDGGLVWTKINHGIPLTGGRRLGRMATTGAGTVLIAVVAAGLDEYAYSTDSGGSWTHTNTGLNFGVAASVSYGNGLFILGIDGAAIEYSASGLPGTWSLTSYSSVVVGAVYDFVWTGTYWFGRTSNNAQVRTTDPALVVSVPSIPDRRFSNALAMGPGVVVYVDQAADDPVFPGIYTTLESLVLTPRASPPGEAGFRYYDVFFRTPSSAASTFQAAAYPYAVGVAAVA